MPRNLASNRREQTCLVSQRGYSRTVYTDIADERSKAVTVTQTLTWTKIQGDGAQKEMEDC